MATRKLKCECYPYLKTENNLMLAMLLGNTNIYNIYQWPTSIIQFYIFWFQMKQINEQIDSKTGLENGVVDTGFNFNLKQLKKKKRQNKYHNCYEHTNRK